ncbi:hypothetical protein CPB84DRAFT_1774009, partial [Gymnopilus junonius]
CQTVEEGRDWAERLRDLGIVFSTHLLYVFKGNKSYINQRDENVDNRSFKNKIRSDVLPVETDRIVLAAPGSHPESVGNSLRGTSESSIWSYNAKNQLSTQWINPDGYSSQISGYEVDLYLS